MNIRALVLRVTLIVIALAFLPMRTLDARDTGGTPPIRLKPDPTVLRGTVLRGTVLRGTVLKGTDLKDTVLDGTALDRSTALKNSGVDASVWNRAAMGSIDPRLFGLALNAASCAARTGAVAAPASTLTVIDYSTPSTEKRLWVFDLKSHELLYEELVAHGQGSGGNVPTLFSNDSDTHRTSLGLFVTRDTYIGKNGYSLRLDGLDRGFNDHALERAIVMHGAPYVSAEFAKAQGRLGRSWGCPALREGIAKELIDRVKGGGLVFAYYPDPNWLATSQYLNGCGGPAGPTA